MNQPTHADRNTSRQRLTALHKSQLPGVLATARLEFLLTIRSPGFWLVQLVILASSLMVLTQNGFSGTFLRFSSQQLRELVAFNLLLLPLLALPSLQRLQGSRGDLVATTRLDSTGQATGTLLGIYSWLLPATVVHLASRWLLGELINGQANWTLLTYAPPLALASLTLALGVLACLTLIWERILPILLVWLGLWVLVLQGAGGLLGGFVGPHMPLFNAWNILYEGLALSPSIGPGWNAALLTRLAIWIALLGAALLALWLVLLPATDPRKSAHRPYLNYAALLLFGAAAFTANISHHTETARQQPAMTPREVQLDDWHVLESHIDVTVQPESAIPISGTATLALQATTEPQPEFLLLRLREGMSLTASSNGRNLPADRHGDSMHVHLDQLDRTGTEPLVLELVFQGSPQWPYSDHRFQVGGAFPVIDSGQPITGTIIAGVGYLLRDGDWRPWPWTSTPQIGSTHDTVVIRTHDTVTTYHSAAPQLLAASPPRNSWTHNGITIHTGTDPAAGLINALQNSANSAATLWTLLGEAGTPEIIALPYVPDAYANQATILIPEVYDLAHNLQVDAAYQRDLDPEFSQRTANTLLARAWLNGHARHQRGYAEATLSQRQLQANTARGSRSGDAYRLLQVRQLGPYGGAWSDVWLGSDPSAYNIDPFALWLGIELTDAATRQEDINLLRQLTGSELDHQRLRERGLPWNLTRQPGNVGITVALADWTDVIGKEAAINQFADAYRTAENQDTESVLRILRETAGLHYTPAAEGAS